MNLDGILRALRELFCFHSWVRGSWQGMTDRRHCVKCGKSENVNKEEE